MRKNAMIAEKVKKIKAEILDHGMDPINAAERLLEELNYKNYAPIPIVKILNELNFSVYASDVLPQNTSGYILIDPDLQEKFNTDRIIVVKRSDTLGRQRFTLAHEFAHYLFDFNENIPDRYLNAFDFDDSHGESEIRPNQFAAAFLMPSGYFSKKYKELSNLTEYDKVVELMNFFGVSRKSVLKRIEELNLN